MNASRLTLFDHQSVQKVKSTVSSVFVIRLTLRLRSTPTFVVDDGPAFTLTPNGVSFLQVFESTDHKFGSYLAVGTRGWGHERVNVYLSARLQSDLDGTTAGSPFQSILDDHDDTKFDLSNAFIEMRGLGVGRFSPRMSAKVGRQFLPYFRIGMFGSSVMDDGKVAYGDERADAELFIERWAPFYESVDGAVVGGGRIGYELYPDPGSPVGLAPYAEYLYFNDGEGQSAHRHTYGIRSRWKRLDADGYVSVLDTDPIELGVRANYVARRWTVYGRVRKRVSSDEFTYDVFFDFRGVGCVTSLRPPARSATCPQPRANERG
jgi:hypothetical protein